MTKSELDDLINKQNELIQQLYFSSEDSFKLFLGFIKNYEGDIHEKVCSNIKLMTNCEFSKDDFIQKRIEHGDGKLSEFQLELKYNQFRDIHKYIQATYPNITYNTIENPYSHQTINISNNGHLLKQAYNNLKLIFDDNLKVGFSEGDYMNTEYKFPDNLINNDLKNIQIDNSFRINLSHIDLTAFNEKYHLILEELKMVLEEDRYKAFLYNFFDFKGNPTQPTPLSLELNNILIKQFNDIIYRLFDKIKNNELRSIKKKPFAKALFLNFNDYRKSSHLNSFDFDKHIENIEKNIKRIY